MLNKLEFNAILCIVNNCLTCCFANATQNINNNEVLFTHVRVVEECK